jgi:hypothetical protein
MADPKTNDHITVHPEGAKYTIVGNENAHGMIVHRRVDRNRQGWTITHLNTERKLHPSHLSFASFCLIHAYRFSEAA